MIIRTPNPKKEKGEEEEMRRKEESRGGIPGQGIQVRKQSL
jgi:hypothetical protein